MRWMNALTLRCIEIMKQRGKDTQILTWGGIMLWIGWYTCILISRWKWIMTYSGRGFLIMVGEMIIIWKRRCSLILIWIWIIIWHGSDNLILICRGIYVGIIWIKGLTLFIYEVEGIGVDFDLQVMEVDACHEKIDKLCVCLGIYPPLLIVLGGNHERNGMNQICKIGVMRIVRMQQMNKWKKKWKFLWIGKLRMMDWDWIEVGGIEFQHEC